MKTHELWNIDFLNQILDTMAEGLFTMDAKGSITSWNRSMEKITGYPAVEALGKTCSLIECSRCFGKKCPASVNKCGVIKHGRTEAKECHIRHREGHTVPVIKNARLAKDEQGQILGIVETITDLTELKQAKKAADEARQKLKKEFGFSNIIGKSPAMKNVYDAIRAAAQSRATVLIQGDSGTGKELVANAIHYSGSKNLPPFVTVNCSALSETLLESELFGHVKGAFTGAHKDRKGRFEEADGGTIFLDEVGELTPYIQVKLLRVLQEREIERVGDSKKIKIDIRVIAATNKDLLELTQKGLFREDLYYRLKVFPIRLPALSARRNDIPLLIRHFIARNNATQDRQIRGISQPAMKQMIEYDWPGNIRELENAIEHAFVLCRSDLIEPEDLPLEIQKTEGESAAVPPAPRPQTNSTTANARKQPLTKQFLVQLLTDCGWNKAEAARRIGKSRTAVWKYMKKWDIPLKQPN